MSIMLKVRKLNEMMYESVVERFWYAEGADWKGCGIILVRCGQPFQEAVKGIQSIIGPETGGTADIKADPDKGVIALLLFDSALSHTHYTALRIKELLSGIAQSPFTVMLANVKPSAERNPAFFQAVTDVFEQVPASQNVVIFHDHYQSNETQSVLLVDGDEDVRRFLQLRLQLKGYRVLAAKDGKTGLNLFRQERPDVVVTDLNLSGIDGFHFLTRINDEDPEAKVIVFTDNRVEQAISKCFELGVADYITKPFSPVELEARIERLL